MRVRTATRQLRSSSVHQNGLPYVHPQDIRNIHQQHDAAGTSPDLRPVGRRYCCGLAPRIPHDGHVWIGAIVQRVVVLTEAEC